MTVPTLEMLSLRRMRLSKELHDIKSKIAQLKDELSAVASDIHHTDKQIHAALLHVEPAKSDDYNPTSHINKLWGITND